MLRPKDKDYRDSLLLQRLAAALLRQTGISGAAAQGQSGSHSRRTAQRAENEVQAAAPGVELKCAAELSGISLGRPRKKAEKDKLLEAKIPKSLIIRYCLFCGNILGWGLNPGPSSC